MEHSLGEVAYTAYAESVEWQAYNGDPLPVFSHMSARLQDAWCAAGDAVKGYLEGKR